MVIASIALLQPAQGRPAGGGHSVSHGYHFSGSGRYYGGSRYYAGGARYYGGGPRYYAGGARYYAGGVRYYHPYSQTVSRNSAYYSRSAPRSAVNRTTASGPRTSRSNSPLTAAQKATLRSQGVDSQGRLSAQVTRNWSHNQDHFWHGHQCHWHNGCWVLVDWWPWYYPWDWYGYGYGYGYYPYDPYAYYDPGYGDVYSPEPAYDNGYSNSAVSEVQSALTRKGYYHGAIDGRMGPETRSAVRQYQRNHGMEVTGNIDQTVLDALRHR